MEQIAATVPNIRILREAGGDVAEGRPLVATTPSHLEIPKSYMPCGREAPPMEKARALRTEDARKKADSDHGTGNREHASAIRYRKVWHLGADARCTRLRRSPKNLFSRCGFREPTKEQRP